MRIVLLPQAFRVMLPALISQLVVVLKDTSLGCLRRHTTTSCSARASCIAAQPRQPDPDLRRRRADLHRDQLHALAGWRGTSSAARDARRPRGGAHESTSRSAGRRRRLDAPPPHIGPPAPRTARRVADRDAGRPARLAASWRRCTPPGAARCHLFPGLPGRAPAGRSPSRPTTDAGRDDDRPWRRARRLATLQPSTASADSTADDQRRDRPSRSKPEARPKPTATSPTP